VGFVSRISDENTFFDNMESSQQKTVPMVEDFQQGSDAPSSEQTHPQQPDAVVTFSSHDTTPLDAGIVAAAIAAAFSENETIPEPPRPPGKRDSVVAPASLQQEGNEMEAIGTVVTAAVSEKELHPVTSTTTAPIETTAIKSTAENMAELERQTGLVQRKWEEMFSRLQVFKHKEGKEGNKEEKKATNAQGPLTHIYRIFPVLPPGHCLVPNRYPADPQLG
jgi:hypothetical protein